MLVLIMLMLSKAKLETFLRNSCSGAECNMITYSITFGHMKAAKKAALKFKGKNSNG